MSMQPAKASESSFSLSNFSFCPSSSVLTEEEINPSSSQLKNPIIHENACSEPLELSQEKADSVVLDQNRKDMSMQLEKASQSSSNPSLLSFWTWSNWGLEKLKNFFTNESESNEIDCTIRENALKMLGLSTEEAEDRLILDERYQDLYKVLNKRILKVKRSQLLVKEIEKILKQVEKSYHTLTKPMI